MPNYDENILRTHTSNRIYYSMDSSEDQVENSSLQYQQQQTTTTIATSASYNGGIGFVNRLPPSVWRRILRHLPLSQVLELPLVCQDFRDRFFNMPEFWRNAYFMATRHGSSQFVPKVSLWYQGLIFRRWFTMVSSQICDHCYSGFGVDESRYGWLSVQPVRTLLNRRNNSIRRERYTVDLCGPCRVFHYQLQPEPYILNHPSDLDVITASARPKLLEEYGLTKFNVAGIPPQKFTRAFIHIYARVTFGGEVGIEAERKKKQITHYPSISQLAQSQLQKLTREAGF